MALLESRLYRSGGLAPDEGSRKRKALVLNVEVSQFAEGASQPAQLAPLAGKVGRQDLREGAKGGAEAAGGDPHLMDALDVLAEAGGRLVFDEAEEVPPQDGVGQLSQGAVTVEGHGAEGAWFPAG